MSTYVGQHSKLIFSLPPVNWVFGHVFWQRFPSAVPTELRKTKEIQGNSQNLWGGERGSIVFKCCKRTTISFSEIVEITSSSNCFQNEGLTAAVVRAVCSISFVILN